MDIKKQLSKYLKKDQKMPKKRRHEDDEREKIDREKLKKLKLLASQTFHTNKKGQVFPYTVLEYYEEFILTNKMIIKPTPIPEEAID